MKRITLPIAGLVTDASPLIVGAAGAMRQCKEVLLLSGGTAQVRPGFLIEREETPTDYRPRAMTVYDGTVIISETDGADFNLRTGGGVNIAADTHTPLNDDVSPVQFAQSRSNLYIACTLGMLKLTSGADTTSQVAGLIEGLSGLVNIGTGLSGLTTLESTAYRWCIMRVDANGVITRSTPGPWTRIDNTGGSDASVVCKITLASDVIAGDVIELYRAPAVPNASVPSDEMLLSKTYTVTSGDVVAGFATVEDTNPSDNLGASLYTNPTREGILGGNGAPIAAVACAEWQRAMWLGYTQSRHTVVMRVLDFAAAYNLGGRDSALLGASKAATGTIGTNTITVAESGFTPHTGMYVWQNSVANPESASAAIAANTTITGISGYGTGTLTLTLSNNLLASLAGNNVKISDRITIDGTHFYIREFVSLTLDETDRANRVVSGAQTVGRLLRNLAYVVNRTMSSTFAWHIEEPTSGGVIAFRRESLTDDSFVVSTTSAAGSYDFLSGTGTSEADTRPNRLFYSKPDEPEHFPLVNFLSIGSQAEAIVALAPLLDALLVFKTDGIFRVTGSHPDNWRVDQIDSARTMRGSCVDVMDDIAYAWTSRGFVAATQSVVTRLSAGLIERQLSYHAAIMATDPTTEGCFVRCVPQLNAVIFGVPELDGDEHTSKWFVYSLPARGFSQWDIASHCTANDVEARELFHVPQSTPADATGFYQLRKTSPYYPSDDARCGYDNVWSISNWTYTAGSVTITVTLAQRGNWAPAIDDYVTVAISEVTYVRRVTDVQVSGTSRILTIESAFPAGAQGSRKGYETIKTVLEWQSQLGADPSMSATWRDIQAYLAFDDFTVDLPSAARVTVAALSDLQSDEGSPEVVTLEPSVTTATPTRIVRCGAPRDIARSTHVYPRLRVNMLNVPFRVHGIALTFEPTSERTNR